MINNKRPKLKGITTGKRLSAICLILLFLIEMWRPSITYAITGHSKMPEYGSFSPITSSNAVNTFNGSFNYSLPVLKIPNGYPLNLTYNSSKVNTNSLSSWVGLGWDLNVGSVDRVKNGYPDEYDGSQKVVQHSRTEPNWTVSAGTRLGMDVMKFGNLGVSGSASKSYNNYTGLKTTLSMGFNFAGVANLNLTYSAGQFGFNPSINPAAILQNAVTYKKRKKQKEEATKNAQLTLAIADIQALTSGNIGKLLRSPGETKKILTAIKKSQSGGNRTGINSFSFSSNMSMKTQPYPSLQTQYKGFFTEIAFEAGVNPLMLPLNFEAGIFGTFTKQNTEEKNTLNAYGYFHNEKGYDSDPNAAMDFGLEMDKTFQPRESVIGYPIPSNDNFSYSGLAGNGSFRAFRGDFGHYKKNKTYSFDVSADVSIDTDIPAIIGPVPGVIPYNMTAGVGGGIGGSYHSTETDKWKEDNLVFLNDIDFPKSNEKYFFRNSGDKAGYYDLSWNQPMLKGNLTNTSSLSNADIDIPFNGSNRADYRSLNKSKQRSQYIETSKNTAFDKEANGSVSNSSNTHYAVNQKELKIIDSDGSIVDINTERSTYKENGLGEFAMTTPDGNKQVYGLPAYVRNEKELQYSFPKGSGLSSSPQWAVQNVLEDVSGSASDIDANSLRKSGVEDGNSYPTAFLLTSMLSKDYIDRTGNGPSRDDFGNYTKVNYKREFGGKQSGNKWFGYRSPYKGVNFSLGSLSEDNDDMGSFSYGEKEVYYIHSIESKSHVAFFITKDRNDGKPARVPNNATAAQALDADLSQPSGALQKLDRIELYAIDNCEFKSGSSNYFYEPKSGAQPEKVVKFEYDYDLTPNVLNNSTGNRGKLTLKRVYIESGGAVKSKISPYEFTYDYPNSYPAPYNSGNYVDFKGVGWYTAGNFGNSNPPYSPVNSDRWGSYRDYSYLDSEFQGTHVTDLEKFFPYTYQNPDYKSSDPAAYLLKQIKLPSGGKMVIQYEENDYHYVQNKNASVMVRLKHTSPKAKDYSTRKYYLDLSSLGIHDFNNLTSSQKKELTDDLFRHQLVNKERLYFSYLYALLGQSPNYKKNDTEFIEGYARPDSYGYDSYGIFFRFKTPSSLGSNEWHFSYSGTTSKREMPQKVCKSYYKTKRKLKIDGGSNASSMSSSVDSGDEEALGLSFLSALAYSFSTFDVCKYFQPDMSMVRLAVPSGHFRKYKYNGSVSSSRTYYSKLGGGLRVKRLLFMDEGTSSDNHGEILLGSEYSYTTTNADDEIISSGVATNEPSSGRKENALVTPIERGSQGNLQAILFGRDMYSQEGPIGEGVLPSPSIGYSRVEVKPIYKGKNTTGKTVHEFHTVKEDHIGFESKKTQLEVDNGPMGDLPTSLAGSVSFGNIGVSVSYTGKTRYLSQGFEFHTFQGHGSPKSTTKYDGNNTLYSREDYTYYDQNGTVKLMGEDLKITNVPVNQLGTEAEICGFSQKLDDVSFGGRVDVMLTGMNFGVILPPIVTPIVAPIPASASISANISKNNLRKHAITKIVSHPFILKKITAVEEGRKKVTENLVFDDYTGEAVVTSESEDFTDYLASTNAPPEMNNTLTTQKFKGSWKYKNLRPSYVNEDLITLPPVGGSITGGYDSNDGYYLQFDAGGNVACSQLSNFVKGDFIELNGDPGLSEPELFHIDEVDNTTNRVYLAKSMYNGNASGQISSSILSIKVHESGYTNDLTTTIGETVFLTQNGNYMSYTSNLDPNHPLAQAMQNQLGSINFTPGSFYYNDHTVSGPFYNVDLTNFSSWGNALNININYSSADVKEIVYDIYYEPAANGVPGVVHLAIKEIVVILSGGGTKTIHCEEQAWTW
ncbi:hypothetical protein [Salibacter halophilus]|uniref:AGC-kinase C-terminal domain-containing protein n=1 Tax=Salibacter halophilus TaxID=1803916 RepID=A0A6N6MAM6_9FLAO|nr:hypothetical protein [Salibacter halophilus]KAB1065896.1 hypothetical protein F3059_00035 [Salibacter halophilus]